VKRRRHNPWYTAAESEAEAIERAEVVKLKGAEALDAALATAVRFRDLVQAKAYLDVGANPDWKDALNTTVLDHAITSHRLEFVVTLLTAGADPNLRTGLGTPLTLTIYEEQWDMMHALLDAGADVNAIGTIRSTALHVVVQYSPDLDRVKLLLKHGANVNAKDAEGLTPLDWAERNKDMAIIRLLKAAGAMSGSTIDAVHPKEQKGKVKVRRVRVAGQKSS
jgi:ankyrin repeat protein